MPHIYPICNFEFEIFSCPLINECFCSTPGKHESHILENIFSYLGCRMDNPMDKPFISSDSAVNARNFGVRSVILSLFTFQLVNSTFFDFSLRSISSFSPCVTHKTEFPLELFRAVRPARWIYSSGDSGQSN